MADELTYDIAPADQSVISEEELHDSAKANADRANEFPVAEPVHGSSPAPTPGWTEAARFKPVERPDPFPFLDEEPAPSEDEKRDALVKLSPNSGLSEEEADKYATVLKKYYEAEDAESLAQKKDNLKAQFRTPEGLLQITKNPVVRQEMDLSPDDDMVAKRALNRNYLAIMYDKPNASPEELDALMREHSIKHWGINNPSQETFYTKTREDILKSDEETKVFRSAAKAVAVDVLGEEFTNKRTSASERFEKLAKANPKVITAQNRDQWYQTMVLMEDRIRHLNKNARFPAATILDLAEKMTTGEPTEIDWNRGINALRNINPNDLKQALKIASIAARELDPQGGMVDTVVSNLAKRFGRDYTLRQGELADSKRTLSEIKEKAAAGKLVVGEDANGKPYYAMDGRPLPAWVTPVDPAKHVSNIERELEGIRIIQTLQNFQEQVRDPVTPYFKGGLLGMAEGGVYDVAGFSKLLPLGLVRGPAGLMTMAKVIGDKYFLDLTYQNPDLDIKTASRMSALMGTVEAWSMKFKAEFLVGNYAIFKSMRTLSGTGKALEAFKVFAKWNLVHQAEENFEELAQDTSSAVVQKLFADANPKTMKQQSWNDLISDIATSRVQVAFAVAPLSLIGAGHATVRDLRNPMRDFMNPDALKSVGLSDEQVAEVMGAGGLEEAEKVFRKHYNTLTPEAIKAGFEYATGLGEQAEVEAAMADPALPYYQTTILPDGTYKYTVFDENGKILSTHTDPDAAETAWIRETERVNDERAASMQDEANQEAAQKAEADEAAAASDEGVAKEAEAKTTAETVSPEDRLGTALTVDFEEHATPTQQESREVAQLEADVRASGRADTIIRARPSDIQTSAGNATLGFVRAFEKLTGKRVVFVASGTDQPLSFTGAVRPGDPNTIFLDAHGDRNILALVGHEWSHTLEKTNPALHAEMLGRMKGAIVDWAKQEGILAQEVDPANVTNEMVANIVGDAIANESFWTGLAQKDAGLFARVRDAVVKFIGQFAGKLKSEFGTEAFANAQEMQKIVADVMQRASAGPEVTAPLPAIGDTVTIDGTKYKVTETGLSTSEPDTIKVETMDGRASSAVRYFTRTEEGKAAAAAGAGAEAGVSFAPRGTFAAPKLESDQVYINALREDRRPLWGMARNLPKGTKVGVRIDIPAFLSKGVYVQTIHEPKTGGEKGSVGKVIGYDSMATIDNPIFWAHEKAAQAIQTGKTTKIPIATVEGNFDPSRTIPRGIVMGWAPVGFNPHKHSYFYDKETGDLVEGGERAISIGNTVYVKNPIYGDKSKALFAGRRGEHKMDIERQARFTSKETEYTPAEKADLEGKLSKLLDKTGIKGKARTVIEAQHRQELEDEIRRQRERHPIVPPPEGEAHDKWVRITPVDVEIVTKKEKGKPDREVAIPVWQKEAYQFDKADMSKVVAGMVADVRDIVRRAKAGDPNAITQLRQRGWYRNMTVRLRTEFGGFSDLFADLLGATSPNTQVDQNWKFSVIALREVTRGTYDKELAHFDAWLKSGRTVKEYKDTGQPQILQPNGKLFGMNSDKAMKAMLDFWRVVKAGDSPKARNFALNLIGQSFKATIDVWAARYLGRMALNDRIPVIAEKALSGKHKVDVTKVGGAFGYGQEAFRQATEILVREMPEEFAGMQPPDLQAVVWFREKEIWGRNNWTSTSGEGGSFEASADIEQVQRYVAGLSHERPKAIPTTEQQETASQNLNNKLAGFPETIATRVKNSIGMYDGRVERSFDIELLAGPEFDPWQMVLTVAESASANNQDSTFVSRVIQAGEPINPNARPGIEVYLKGDVDLEAMNAIMDAIKEGGTDGFTMVVDPRKEVGPQGVRGIRAQYIPEFGGPEEWQNEAAQKKEAILGILSKVIAMEGVATAQLVSYDTLVLTRDEYGSNLTQSELAGRDVGDGRAQVWRERASDAAHSRAAQGGEGSGAVSEAAIPDRVSEPSAPSFAGRRKVGEPVSVTAFDRQARGFVQKSMPPSQDLLNDLQREKNIYEKLLSCLS